MLNWIYNESKHCGVNYSDLEKAAKYDAQHLKFRNYEQEFNEMLEFLELKNTQNLTLIDLGCGTGATALYASKKFKKIYAVDISEVMILQAKKKMEQENTKNIQWIQSGFLTYQHQGEAVDLVLSKAAFHHLPDFWKQIALLRINAMLKPGGIFYLFDVVFHFKPEEYLQKITDWVSSFEKKAGKEFSLEVETHIRDEFSTFNWVLEEMLRKAGFEIIKNKTMDGFITEYFCRKIKNVFGE